MDGYSYDAAGNVLNDGAGHSFTYEAETRIVQVGTNVSYVYDGEGRRIRKTVSGASTDFFYDLESHEIAEMNSAGGWNRGEVFAAGRHIATYNWGTTFFNHLDWLGTERARTAISGAVSETCTSLPFGDAQSCSGSETSPNHFTGKDRDTESNLDYFGARYFSSTMGHWMSPDWSEAPESVPYAVLADPQTLNLYGYVRNNPMSKVDADGHCPPCILFEDIAESPAGQELEQVASKVGQHVVSAVIAGAATAYATSRGWIERGFQALEANGGLIPVYGFDPIVPPISLQKGSAPASPQGSSSTSDKPGEVYVTDPQESGKEYVGRTTQGTDKRMQTRGDGRTGSAQTVDTYETTEEGRYKEQKAIDQRGGKQNLDNKRNEVAPDKMKKLEDKFGNGT
jgi:RHS repeat-associated protein